MWRRLRQTRVMKKFSQPHTMWCLHNRLHNRLFRNSQLFSAIIRYLTKWHLIISFQLFNSQEKPHSKVTDIPRALGIRNTRSSTSAINNEANTATTPAFVTTKQLNDQAVKRRQALKDRSLNVSFLTVVMLNLWCAMKFWFTASCCLLFTILGYFLLTNYVVILSFQQTKVVRMEETNAANKLSDDFDVTLSWSCEGLILKYSFADHVRWMQQTSDGKQGSYSWGLDLICIGYFRLCRMQTWSSFGLSCAGLFVEVRVSGLGFASCCNSSVRVRILYSYT